MRRCILLNPARRRGSFPVFLPVLLSSLAPALTGAAASEAPAFESHVLPILESKCVSCHGADSPQKELDLRTRESLLRGGASGPAAQAGSAADSLLVAKIISGQMPPVEPKLTEREIDVIRAWIDAGAPASIGRPTAPQVTERDILPIIQAGCLPCHGKSKQEGGLDLRTNAGRLKGGKSGPAIVPGKPEESLMVQKIEAREMPPLKLIHENTVKSPTQAQLEMLKQWIAAGAPATPQPTFVDPVTDRDRDFSSFRPPQRPRAPPVKSRHLVRNPIDAFLLRKLEGKGLSYSPETDKVKLLRRIYLDLTGMPPSPEQVRDYLDDNTADAYEKLVDSLLDSPEYAERWARHWLDLAGYSDSRGIGFLDVIRPYAWRYRDYVIRSLEADKPYNQFLTEQIAGDELSDYKKEPVTQELIDRLAATGFLRTTPDPTYEYEFAYIPERMTVIAQTVEVLGSAVMGLTIGCARCHDHKYDPIPQRDYYRFSSILQSAYDPYDWRAPKDRRLDIALESERAETAEFNVPIEARSRDLRPPLRKSRSPSAKNFGSRSSRPCPKSCSGISGPLRERRRKSARRSRATWLRSSRISWKSRKPPCLRSSMISRTPRNP